MLVPIGHFLNMFLCGRFWLFLNFLTCFIFTSRTQVFKNNFLHFCISKYRKLQFNIFYLVVAVIRKKIDEYSCSNVKTFTFFNCFETFLNLCTLSRHLGYPITFFFQCKQQEDCNLARIYLLLWSQYFSICFCA